MRSEHMTIRQAQAGCAPHTGSRRWPALFLLAAFALAPGLSATAQTPYKKLKYPPLKDLTLPQVERVELPNGLVLYLVEDHTLPKVEGYALIRTGARFEPAEKVGLADVTGEAMRTGGTTSRKGEEIDRLLENVGASVDTGVGTTAGTSTTCRAQEPKCCSTSFLTSALSKSPQRLRMTWLGW